MNDMNDKIRERWQERRKKGYNWSRLIIMLAILVAIMFAINRLSKTGKTFSTSGIEIVDSIAVFDSLFEETSE
ncbi:MAG: hypothetical protein Q8M98_01275 [Candidatus Cloacimonadaceae bacterium]|nr:hypothetical protein [Candidatus Cloacimonadaceae bacterium]MDP3113382.1 hypothetical protein [Candidatus Cloacimonadaceae bacterium]